MKAVRRSHASCSPVGWACSSRQTACGLVCTKGYCQASILLLEGSSSGTSEDGLALYGEVVWVCIPSYLPVTESPEEDGGVKYHSTECTSALVPS